MKGSLCSLTKGFSVEPSIEAKENAAALKQADPEDKKAFLESGGKDAGARDDGTADYKPSNETEEGKDLDEGVELEPVDDEVV